MESGGVRPARDAPRSTKSSSHRGLGAGPMRDRVIRPGRSWRHAVRAVTVASDPPEGKLNTASILLEISRRTGAGLRVPLKVDSVSHSFFPGQIVALEHHSSEQHLSPLRNIIPVINRGKIVIFGDSIIELSNYDPLNGLDHCLTRGKDSRKSPGRHSLLNLN